MSATPDLVTIEVRFYLPYALELPEGEYPVFSGARQRMLHLSRPESVSYIDRDGGLHTLRPNEDSTLVTAVVPIPAEEADPQPAMGVLKRCLGQTLYAANFLTRWYRSITGRVEPTHLIPELVSLVLFRIGDALETLERDYRPQPSVYAPITPEQVDELRTRLTGDEEPAQEKQLLFNARRAAQAYRFEEAVMLAWSAIDLAFEPFLWEQLQAQIPWVDFGPGSAGRNVQTDLHFTTRVDILLYLLTGYSFRQDDNFWRRLSTAREVRNQVIHTGRRPNEEQVLQTLSVAEDFVTRMDTLRAGM